MNGTLHRWSTDAGEELSSLVGTKDLSDGIEVIRFEPTGQQLAVGWDSGRMETRDPDSLQVRQVFDGHRTRICDIDFSPNGSIMASIDEDGILRLWDTHSSAALAEVLDMVWVGELWCPNIAFSPLGTTLAATTRSKTYFFSCPFCGPIESVVEQARSIEREFTPLEQHRFGLASPPDPESE